MPPRNVVKSTFGRFASGLPIEVHNKIEAQVGNPEVPLTEVAKKAGVSLVTVLRRKGARLSVKEKQRLYFKILKTDFVKPVVEELLAGKKVVTVALVRSKLFVHHQGNFSRGLVSRALNELSAEGMNIPRTEEHETALRLQKERHDRYEPVYKRIIDLRKRFPTMKDEELAKESGVSYTTLRKMITYLKKSGRLPSQKRGYSPN